MTTANHSVNRDGRSDRTAIIGWMAVVLAFSLPLYRPWLSLSASGVMLLWIFSGDLRRSVARLRHHRLTIAILVFVAANLASLLWTSDPAAGLRYVAKYRYLLLVPMLATALPRLYRERAAAAFQIGAVAAVGLSLSVALGYLNIGDAHPGNPSPTMAHLDFSLILAVSSLLALTRALYGKIPRFERVLWLAASATAAAGALFNIGRSGQLGFLAGLIVLLSRWVADSSRRAAAAAAAVVLMGVVAAAALTPPVSQRMSDAGRELRAARLERDFESNVGGRYAAIVVAGHMVREDPIFGTGVGGNMARFRHILDTELEELKPSIYWYRHFHNQYAQVATELGIAGLFSLIWIFWTLVRGPYRSRELGATASTIAAVYLVAFLGEPFLHKQIPLIAFAFVAGLIAGEQLEEIENTTEG